MGLKSKLGIEYKGMFFFAMFYLITGILNLIILGIYGLTFFHVALVAILSLIAAFGLYQLQRWSLWFVVGLFFIATTYGAITLNAYLTTSDLLAVFAWIIYLILTWLATMYVLAMRKNLR